MAVPTGTLQTFQQVGIREDLSDYIHNIDPVEVPFFSMCRKGKTSNRFYEWQQDTLASPRANAVVEGDDATTRTAVATTRLRDFTQLFDNVARVSTSGNAVNAAGRKNELAYQVTKRVQETRRDVEQALTQNQGSSAGTASTPRMLGGLESWYTSNTQRGADSEVASGGYSSANNTTSVPVDSSAGGQRTFTETLLKTAVRTAWSAGGNPRYIMTGPFNKQISSTFPGIATLYRDTAVNPGGKAPASILAAADYYVSDFGNHTIIPNRFQRERTVHVLDMDRWEVRYLQPWKVENLAKTGHSERRMISAELTLVCENEAANAVIADLLTSGYS